MARNGLHDPWEVATVAGAVPVRQPRVNDKRVDEITGERIQFSSAILPACCRKCPGVAEILPLLHLHGLSSGDFVPALEQFLGSAAGLSAATVNRLTAQWQDEEGIDPSVGFVGAALDNALAETTVGSFQNELIRRQGPWRDVDHVELATAEWVAWFNTQRPRNELDDFTPEAVERLHYARRSGLREAG